jgi:hypothetical protein
MVDPFALPAVNATDTWLSPAVATRPDGAEGVVRGVVVTLSDAVPDPTALTAFNTMVYVVPLVNPDISIGEVVEAVLGVTNDVPPSVLYW